MSVRPGEVDNAVEIWIRSWHYRVDYGQRSKKGLARFDMPLMHYL